MAEAENKAPAPAKAAEGEKTGRPPKKKKSRPTNCAQSNKRIRRKDWYYRNGKYFANKKNFKLFVKAEAEKAEKAKKASEAQAAAPAPDTEKSAAS